MRKLTTLMLALGCVIVALACGSSDPDVDGTTGATQQNGDGQDAANGKMLVVYFSRAGENWQVGYVERGNTAIMVDYIKEQADVDVFEVLQESVWVMTRITTVFLSPVDQASVD